MNTIDLSKKIDEAIEDLPEEVVPFLFDGEFASVFDTYKQRISDPEVFFGVKNKTFQFILGISSIDELKEFIENNILDKTLAGELKRDIQEKIIDTLLINLEGAEKTNEVNNATVEKNSDILTRLNQSFSAPTTLAPVKRDYSVARTEPTGTTPVAGIPEKKIDPYREMPEV